jgi:hypothetical protein
LRERRLADHPVAGFADLRREVRNLRDAFHLDELSRGKRWRALGDVHPDTRGRVLHEHVGSIGAHERIAAQKVGPRGTVIRYNRSNADRVATRGLICGELADLGDVRQDRQRGADLGRLAVGGCPGQDADRQHRKVRWHGTI